MALRGKIVKWFELLCELQRSNFVITSAALHISQAETGAYLAWEGN